MPWVAGRPYFLSAYNLGGGRWGAWVVDGATGATTTIGTLSVPVGLQKLIPTSVTFMNWAGPLVGACSAYPLAQALMAPVGFAGGQARIATFSRDATPAGTDCPGMAAPTGAWAGYSLGSPRI